MRDFVYIPITILTILSLVIPQGELVYAVTPDSLVNGGFETPGTNSRQAFDWQPFGSGYTRLAYPHTGLWSIRLRNTSTSQTSGAYQRIDLNQTELKPVFIGGYVSGTGIKNSPSGYFGASLYAEIHMQNGAVAYWNSIANLGTFTWRWIGFNTGSLASVNQPITHIFVVPILSQASGTAYFDDLVVTEFLPTQAAVTLMFDDGEETTFTKAKPILDNYGMKASASIITEMIDEPGFLSSSQLQTLGNSGWEIVSHTVTHTDLTTLKNTKIIQELLNSKSELERLGLTVKNLSLPYGTYNGYILAESAKYYGSARAFEIGDNPQGTYPFDVKVRGVINTTPLEQVNSWVTDALGQKRWLVLVFHTIADAGDDTYHTSPEALESIVDAVAASGINVVTYQQGVELFRVRP